MGIWSQNPITKAWTLSGSGRTALVASNDWTGDRAVRLRLAGREHQVAVLVPCSKLGDSGLRVGIDAADKTKVSVCPVDFYTIASAVTTNAGDIPSSGAASVSHSIGADGQPFTLVVRVNKGSIEVYIDDETVPTIQWTGEGDHKYAKLRHVGFEAGVDGATVLAAELVALNPASPSPQVEVLFAVCQGDLHASAEGDQMARVGASQFVRDGTVRLAEYQGFVYGVDGTNAREIDPQDYSVTQWTASAGTFPGSTVGVAGSTRCTGVFVDGARIGLFGDPTLPNAVFWSAINDSHDHDAGNLDAPGRAYALTTDLPGLINEPITAVFQGTHSEVLIGTISACFRKVGDPALGLPDIHAVSRDHGVSGPTSIVMANDGLSVYHSSDGLFVVPTGGTAVNLSETVLTKYLQIDRDQLAGYIIIAARDPKRHQLHVFLTPRESGPAYHVRYDERVGQYSKGQGGFFIDTYPDRCGPTAACIYRGQLVLGTRDGYLCVLDDAGTADDGGEPVEFRAGVSLMVDGDQAGDTQLEELRLTLGAASSDLRFEVYGGSTAEEALVGADRWLLYRGVARADNPGKAFTQRVRAKAIAVELLSDAAGERPALEKIEATTTVVAPGRRRPKIVPPAPSAPCTPATSDTGGGFDTGPGEGALSIEHILVESYRSDEYAMERSDEAFAAMTGQDPGSGFSWTHADAEQSSGGSVVVVPF